jgi:pimeloyl-ACP methyl ester carboxylesterase
MHQGFFHPGVAGHRVGGVEDLPSPAEEVFFSAPGGPRLHGWWMPAAGSRSAVVYLHGNASDIRERSRIELAERLRGMGHSVLLFDYRGYGLSEGRPEHEGVLEDARAAVGYAASLPGVDRVALYGRSLGGALAICAADVSPEVGAVVTEGAFSSARRIVAHHAGRLLTPPVGSLLTRLLFSSPIEPLDCASRVDVPVLLLHAERDRVVPASMAVELEQALGSRVAGLHVVQGEGHDTALATGELSAVTRAFLEEQLAAVGGGAGTP